MTRRAVDIPASLRAINAHIAAAAGDDAPAVLAARATRAAHARQGRTAQRTGDAWEREVYAALDAAGLAWWAHTSPTSKRLRDGRVIVTGRALCDVVGATADGRALVAEVKRGAARVELVAGDRGGVQPHQRAQLDATARAGGVALLVVCVGDVRAVVPWCDLRDVRAVTATVARRYAVGTLAGALRGVAAPAGAADGAGRVETRVTPVARPHGAVAGDGGAAKGARR